jgi:tRNA(fMet)-specific endonuclease VapC
MADSLLVVDTDLVIDYLRDRAPGASRVYGWLERDLARFAALTAFELRLGTDFARRAQAIETLLSARTLPLDHAAALLAGEIYVRLRAQGTDIGVNDCLLAGTCLRFDLPLATRNTRHFERVAGLQVVRE